jgi:hypothetical protein
VVLAEDGNNKASPPKPVEAYIAKALGDHLDHVRRAIEALAANFEPKKLNCVGFRLYEHFRPEVLPDVKGWAAKGMLDLEKIHRAGGAE